MNHRNNPLFWSFYAGHCCGVTLRVSWLMPLVLAWLPYEFGWKLGLSLFSVMFVSVLLHEIGHILVANATDGSGDEILMWPLGGLAFVETSTPRSQCLTAAAGPIVNLLLCCVFIPAAYWSDSLPRALNPVVVPFDGVTEAAGQLSASLSYHPFGSNIATDLQVLMFWFNWLSLLINLLPAYPLDGGQIVGSWLKTRMGADAGGEFAIRVGIGAAIFLLVVNLFFFKQLMVSTLAFTIIVLAINEMYQMKSHESEDDDTFLGYDFSDGYQSLERSEPVEPQPKPSLWERWTSRRRAEKQRKLAEQEQATEQQLDAILAKVHEQGLSSLTAAENRLLKRASNRYRSKGTEPNK